MQDPVLVSYVLHPMLLAIPYDQISWLEPVSCHTLPLELGLEGLRD